MDLTRGLEDLVAVALLAALAPLVVAVLSGPRIPQIVIFLLGGVLIGSHGLGLAESASIQLLSNTGLGFLFLLAGFELDPRLLWQRPGRLGILGWLISAAIAVGVVAGLDAAGYVKDYVPVGLALTTTALGVLLPILRDNSMLGGESGRQVHATGTVGELFPILVIAVSSPSGASRRAGLGSAGGGTRPCPVRRAAVHQEPRGPADHPGEPGRYRQTILRWPGAAVRLPAEAPGPAAVEMTFILVTTMPLLIALRSARPQPRPRPRPPGPKTRSAAPATDRLEPDQRR
jgi:hypothetical protein